MRTERREANLLRAEGQEISQKLRLQLIEKIEIIAEAEKQSNILKGEGEASRNQILNEAFAKDPEFLSLSDPWRLILILLKMARLLWLYLLTAISLNILKMLKALKTNSF